MAKAQGSNEGSGGKLVDTLWYEYEGIPSAITEEDDEQDAAPPQTVVRKKVAVELRLLKSFKNDDGANPPLSTSEAGFQLTCNEAGIRLKGSDIEALRKAMWADLDKKYAVKWHDYYLVQVTPGYTYEGIGEGLDFNYTRVEKGVAWDGTLLLRKFRRHYSSGGSLHEITPWPGEFRDKSGKVMACIPATSANTAALEEFARKIAALRGRLGDMLRPKAIMATLANLNTLALLAAPVNEEDIEHEN